MKQFTERQLIAYTLRQEGRTFKSIGLEMNITGSAVRKLCNRYERKVRYNTVISDFISGKSIEWLAIHHGYSNSILVEILLKEKVISKKDIVNFVLSDHARGVKVNLIAKTYGLHVGSVEKILRDEEVKKSGNLRD